MEWTHKGIRFEIQTQTLGEFTLASTPAQREGMFVRVRPFSALGRTSEEAIDLLKQQIRQEYRKVLELSDAVSR